MNKWILLLCTALTACNGNPQAEKACQRIDMTTVLDENPENIALSDWSKSIRYIPLETNDSILIGYIASPIFIEGDRMVIYHKRVSIFDLTGKFICHVSKNGGGPEDYSSIGNFWADKEGIHLLDSKKWIKTFNWEGKWLNTKAIPERGISEVFPLSDGRIAGYVQNISGSEPNRFHIFRDTTVVQSIPYAKSFTPGTITMVFYNECKLFETTQGTCFKEIFNDTLFAISNKNELRPVWNIDLGKYRVAEDARYTLKDPRGNIFEHSANLEIIGECNEELFFSTYFNNEQYLLSYNEKENKAHNLVFSYPDNAFAFPEKNTFIPRNISNDGKYLVGYEMQENDENPVVILVER